MAIAGGPVSTVDDGAATGGCGARSWCSTTRVTAAAAATLTATTARVTTLRLTALSFAVASLPPQRGSSAPPTPPPTRGHRGGEGAGRVPVGAFADRTGSLLGNSSRYIENVRGHSGETA